MWPQDVFFSHLLISLLSSSTGSESRSFREVKKLLIAIKFKAQFRQKMTFRHLLTPVSLRHLEQHEGEEIMTEFSSLVELSPSFCRTDKVITSSHTSKHKLLQMTLGHVSKRIWHNAKKKTTISYVTTYMSIQHLCAITFVCQLL